MPAMATLNKSVYLAAWVSLILRTCTAMAVADENLQKKSTLSDIPHDGQTIGPLYNPHLWHKKLNVTNEPQTYIDCNLFPDDMGLTLEHDPMSPWHEVFCWYNSTLTDPAGHTYLRTTTNCYLDEMDVIAGSNGTLEIDFTNELPWCGPIRPYAVDSENMAWYFGPWYNSSDYTYGMPCWRAPNNSSEVVMTPKYSPHLYCWGEGQRVDNTTRWYENAHLEKGEKCYLPAAMLLWAETGKLYYTTPGSDLPCSEDDWPDWP